MIGFLTFAAGEYGQTSTPADATNIVRIAVE